MQILLDSADVDEVRRFMGSDAIAGVTTNPSLVSKTSRRPYLDLLREIADLVPSDRHLSVEVTTVDPSAMLDQALELGGLFPRAHVKIPVMPVTLPLISKLARCGVRVNATACMTALQAMLAANAGANVVSFFYNRMRDGHRDSLKEGVLPPPPEPLEEIGMFCSAGWATEVICGSIRRVVDIYECFRAGATYVTVSPTILRDALQHPKTVEAIGQFQRDIEAWQG